MQKLETVPVRDMAFDPSIWIDDIAVINANITTLDPNKPQAEAVLVQRGRITAVGSNDEVRAAAGPNVRTLDARGRGVVPGFVDTHAHIEWTAASLSLMENFWDEREPKNIQEVLDRLRARAAKTPPGGWVIGDGNIAFAVEEQRMPTTAEMDQVSTSHHVVLVDMFHSHTANTLATAALGYLTPGNEVQMRWSSNNEPHAGGVVNRCADGCPSGAHDLVFRLPKDVWSVEQLKTAIRSMAHHNFTEGGVTTVSPMAILSCNEYLAEQELHAEGELPLRIRAIYVTPSAVNLDPVLQAGIARGTGNDMFRVGGVKIFADGARVGGGPIVLSAADSTSDNEELARAANSRQIFSYTQDQLAALVGKIQLYGFPVQLHCLSEEGTELVTAAIEDVRRLGIGEDLRHRIEHWLPALPLAERMKDANLGFSLIATHPGYDPTWAQTPNTPYKSYVEKGIKPVLISDRCGGYKAPVRPLYSIARACLSIDEGGEAALGNELKFEDALKMWTLWAAESTHQDADRGSIEIGKLGDFAVLSGDPSAMTPSELLDLRVDATILGGKVVHDRLASESS